MDAEQKIKVLFVCLGNICRSPAGEIIFSHKVNLRGINDRFHIDSAGTEASWPGAKPDSRMRKALAKRGYAENSHRARKLVASDLERFDLIVTMDNDNYRETLYLDAGRRFSDKVVKMARFAKKHPVMEIPDPWYGGQEGFYEVIDLLEEACEHFLNFALERNPS